MTRNQQIYALRQGGETLMEAGRRFGLSHQRVHRICFQEEEKRRRDGVEGFAGRLSPRVRRVLRGNYPDLSFNSPAFLRDVGANELRSLNGLGKGGVKEIAGALEAEGLVANRL